MVLLPSINYGCVLGTGQKKMIIFEGHVMSTHILTYGCKNLNTNGFNSR